MISRRYILKWFFGLPLLSLFPFQISDVRAQATQSGNGKIAASIGEFFAGEELQFEISFMFLKKVAVARMTFKRAEKKGRYISVLEGETVGIVGWLSRYRADTYCTVMEETEGGMRLRSVSFDENVRIGKKTRTFSHEFDYEKKKWIKRSTRRGARLRTVEAAIPEGKVYDDFLCASYNFRYGVYGPLERGRTYIIPTFPRKRSSKYEIKIAAKEKEDHQRVADKVGDEAALLLQLKLDPEITDSKTGIIDGWLSKDNCPLEGIIRDAILFGDVHGKLVSRIKR